MTLTDDTAAGQNLVCTRRLPAGRIARYNNIIIYYSNISLILALVYRVSSLLYFFGKTECNIIIL